ncbi:hypothetical protein SETIT_2G180500v2 [Setaria italica]|uniref:Uncharacterized protein n=1 Tax=Setaria italica TaxID=4555 RepID=A0A368Q0G0_SETIT|nr:hypothetical protein SETIT_2G180500v2 [Setaria italica]
MQRAFLSWKDLQVQSGLGCDKETGGVAADSTFWDDDEGETSAGAAQTSSAKPPLFLDELYTFMGTEDNAHDIYLDPWLLVVLITCLKGQPGKSLLTILRKRKVAAWRTMSGNFPKLW